jgi:uncharacterized damage-inducible protein DinB
MNAPEFPVGEFSPKDRLSPADRMKLIEEISGAPEKLRQAVADLSAARLDTKYRNWTIRQIVHHIPDSHVNCYVRCKWALTEDSPVIKTYEEDRWVALEDSLHGDVNTPLVFLDALHARWVQLFRALKPEQFALTFVMPTQLVRTLDWVLSYYTWHGRHHTGQILWLRRQNHW